MPAPLPELISTPLPWDQLEDPDRTHLWQDLCDWVTWFVRRYPVDDEIPPCWQQHPAVVDELTALFVAHAAAYYPGMPPHAPLGWLEQLERALPRLRRWTGSCTSVEHRPTTRTRWVFDADHPSIVHRAGPPPTNPLTAPPPGMADR